MFFFFAVSPCISNGNNGLFSEFAHTGYSIYLYPRLQLLKPVLIEIGAPFNITHPITRDSLNSMSHSLLFSQIGISAVLFQMADLKK